MSYCLWQWCSWLRHCAAIRSLYGGRTEAMRLHHAAGAGETIQYVDVMSLYPYVCKYFKFPIAIQ